MLDVAHTILAQLGGRRFCAMTGAKQFVGSETSLMFTLPGTPGFVLHNIRKVRITLDPSDTYTMTFFRLQKGYYAAIEARDQLYAED
jgi:hypothetical protein